MDENKAERLREIGFTLKNCCGSCTHFRRSDQVFGVCDFRTYEHKKHSDATRKLSVVAYGYCDDFELTMQYRGWEEFRE